jgi:hypothetical protein
VTDELLKHYRTKLISTMSDRELDLAEEDIANCLLRAYEAPKDEKYVRYFEGLSGQANAIQVEKGRRAQ